MQVISSQTIWLRLVVSSEKSEISVGSHRKNLYMLPHYSSTSLQTLKWAILQISIIQRLISEMEEILGERSVWRSNFKKHNIKTPLKREFLLFSKSELLDECIVSWYILALEIVKELASLSDHEENTTTRVIIFVVILEMCFEVFDTLSEDSDLHLWWPSILRSTSVLSDESLFVFFFHHRKKRVF